MCKSLDRKYDSKQYLIKLFLLSDTVVQWSLADGVGLEGNVLMRSKSESVNLFVNEVTDGRSGQRTSVVRVMEN